jgi:hypothetical protein
LGWSSGTHAFFEIKGKLIMFQKSTSMTTSELNKKKLDLIDWINQLTDEYTIEFLDNFKSSDNESDWWDELSESQKNMIEKGMKDVDNANVVSSSEFWDKLTSEATTKR